MHLRTKILLAVSLLMIGGSAYAQETAPVPATPPGNQWDWQVDPGMGVAVLLDGGSFLGVYAEDIDKEKASHYGLREPRGVGITNVVTGSPAEKAGLRKDDVILRFENENVTSTRKLNRLVSEVAPDQTAHLTISRGGTEQEVAVTIGKRNEAETLRTMKTPRVWKFPGSDGDGSFVVGFGNNRRIGISTTQLTKQLSDYFGVTGGVLVTSVTTDGAAAKAGIKAGDVITAVDGAKIEGAGDLSRAINKKKDGDVTLTVVHDKNQRTVTVTPTEAATLAPGQVGRTVVIPRIEIPAIPEVNVHMRSIELPVIPEITVDLPAKIRTIRAQRPI